MRGSCSVPLEDARPIGIFDSGIGGLTVARAIATSLPHETIVYFGDTKRCPYGTRSVEEVRSFVLQVGAWLVSQHVKVIVIACNTATASALQLAQQTFDVPVIGVIDPGARMAIHSTRTRRIGVLGTELTIASGAYARAIHHLDAGAEVIGCAAQPFVELVERELASGAHVDQRWLVGDDVFDTPRIRAIARAQTAGLTDRDIDTVVLGCTHFPLLAGPIRHALGAGVRVVSSAESTTGELAETLACRAQLASEACSPVHRFATTSEDINAVATAGRFIFGPSLRCVEHVGTDELVRLVAR